MAILMQIDGITKSYGDRLLFADVNFGLNEGDKVGIVARNGSGKSTLLGIIAGEVEPDSGTITTRTGLRVAYLEQTPHFRPGDTVEDACLHDHSTDDDRLRLRQMLTQMGVKDVDAPVERLSGGQRKRVAIVRTLMQDADVLLLDEPTNHLDIDVIEWLEGYLRRSRTTLLMVTHDRYFLDRVCNSILEIDSRAVYAYQGNYDYYLRRRAERIEAAAADVERARNLLRKEQDWMNRQPQARAGKAQARIDRYYELRERARRRRDDRQLTLDVRSGRIGSKIFEAENICKSFGDKKILCDFSYTFARGEKIGIVGPNGVGKSTFIKMLQGIVPTDSGEWNVGQTVRFGYYSQDGIEFRDGDKVIDAVSRIADDIVLNDGDLRLSPMQWLQRFLFSVPEQQKYISTLSGGERCRLHLATVLMRQPNFLILDEPTNDLDIATLDMLEDYLVDFGGCAIIVSHDRFFLDNIVDHLFVMKGDGTVKDFPGNYSEYRAWLDSQRPEAAARQSAPKEKPRQERPARMSFKEKQEFEVLTMEIEKLTEEKEALAALFNSGEVIDDVASRAARFQEVTERLDEAELRWLELSEKS